jgi:hypothetical protein
MPTLRVQGSLRSRTSYFIILVYTPLQRNAAREIGADHGKANLERP